VKRLASNSCSDERGGAGEERPLHAELVVEIVNYLHV
jgi:hypothetical protein